MSRNYRLSEILKRVRAILEQTTQGAPFWVTAEISNVSAPKSGHLYLDLSEHDEDKNLLAQCRAVIWSRELQTIKQSLGADFQNVIKKGNQVLVQAIVTFSEVYGFQLQIKDVDLSFSIGNLEKKKQQVIARLNQEGLVNLNKEHHVAVVVQKIALIGSPKTSGYTDLLKQLENNQYGYQFNVESFPCSVQGIKAENEIIEAFDHASKGKFDIIALIRGGGSKLDLEVFNSYQIAKTIAELEIPVWTGIGHETDYSVCDLVANRHYKTPTALASAIVERASNFEASMHENLSDLMFLVTSRLDHAKSRLDKFQQYVVLEPVNVVQRIRGDLHNTATRVINQSNDLLQRVKQKLNMSINQLPGLLEQTIQTKRNEVNRNIDLINFSLSYALHRAIEKNEIVFERIVENVENKLKLEHEKWRGRDELINALSEDATLNRGFAVVFKDGRALEAEKLKPEERLEIKMKGQKFVVKTLKH